MSELEKYKTCMDQIHAPEALYSEVLNMTKEDNYPAARIISRRFVALAAVMTLIMAIGIATYALKPSLYGWGGNFEVRENGDGYDSILHTDSLVDPVEIIDDRMWFVVNDEHIDITGQISENDPFLYEYSDEEGLIHYWIVGMNGPEMEQYGYSESLRNPENDWIFGYTARTNLDPDQEEPAWLRTGKERLGIDR